VGGFELDYVSPLKKTLRITQSEQPFCDFKAKRRFGVSLQCENSAPANTGPVLPTTTTLTMSGFPTATPTTTIPTIVIAFAVSAGNRLETSHSDIEKTLKSGF